MVDNGTRWIMNSPPVILRALKNNENRYIRRITIDIFVVIFCLVLVKIVLFFIERFES